MILSTDGPVSHPFWRLVTDTALRGRYSEDSLYASFGTSPDRSSPLENVYLKIFAVLYAGRPATAADTVRGLSRLFPEDALDLERVAREALLGQTLRDAYRWISSRVARE